MRIAPALLMLTAAAGLSGCGQKGPLYLPDHKPQAVTAPPTAAAPTPASTPAPASGSPEAPAAPGSAPKKDQDDGTPPQ